MRRYFATLFLDMLEAYLPKEKNCDIQGRINSLIKIGTNKAKLGEINAIYP